MRYDLDSLVPLIADMSSDIFSRPVDVSKYNCIYAGAQKNVSMAGVNIVIVKDEALNKVSRQIPTMLDYMTHVKNGSMFNTPPLDGQADMLKELFPDAKNVGLLYCSAEPNSKYQIDTIKPLLEAQGYTCTEFAFTDSNDVASVAQNAASGSDVIYIPTDNTAASCTEAIANVVIPAKVPVIAGEQGICSGCGVATLSIDYNELGQATGEMAYEILVKGANPGDMEVQAAPTFTKMYNKANCEKLGITIPDDYTAIEG